VPSGFQAGLSSPHRVKTAMAVAGSPQPGEIARIPPPLIACRLASALIGSGSLDLLDFGLGWGASWGCNMLFTDSASTSRVDCGTGRSVIRLLLLALSAATLAACAQTSVVSQRSDLRETRHASLAPNKRVASVIKHTPFASHKTADT